MTNGDRHRRLGDRIVRRPRQRELKPVRIRPHRRRRFIIPTSTSALLTLTLGFLLLIAAGTGALMLPIASVPSGSAPPVTALFTATSAVCVTGLAVVHTGTYWTGFGQAVIAVLMFFGGLGITTAGIVVISLIGRPITLNQRLVIRETMPGPSLGTVLNVSRYVVLFVVATQAIGFAVLFSQFIFRYPLRTAAWYALFHSISAFNNAGFDVFKRSDSLVGFQGDYVLLLSIAALIVLGGISFPVVAELVRTRRPSRWTLDTRLVVIGSVSLWLLGVFIVLAFEWSNPATLGSMSITGKVINALFQSVTARTAGFNSINFSATRLGDSFAFLLLMFVGGVSGSTAGGIKVNTAMILIVAGIASVRGRERAEFARRQLAYAQVIRAISVVLLAALVLFAILVALAGAESAHLQSGKFSFLDLLFETVSAFGTVGLSRGITAQLTDPGKLLIILTMYLGRLGPLTIALGLALRERRAVYRFAEERVRIG